MREAAHLQLICSTSENSSTGQFCHITRMLGCFHEVWLLSRAELKESLTRMGSDLKHGFISSLRTAWQTLNDFARAHTASAQLQAELAIVANQIEEQEKQAQEGERFRKIKKNQQQTPAPPELGAERLSQNGKTAKSALICV